MKGGKFMAISSDKVRILVTLPLELKEKLEGVARNENRSVSNYVYTLIQRDIQKKETNADAD